MGGCLQIAGGCETDETQLRKKRGGRRRWQYWCPLSNIQYKEVDSFILLSMKYQSRGYLPLTQLRPREREGKWPRYEVSLVCDLL